MAASEFPSRMIAAGHYPLGEKLNAYQKMFRLNRILGALCEEELEFLRRSPLSQLLEMPMRPSWSANFGLFLLSHQLEVENPNEIWVLFGGTPIRFFLREFKIVTGLRCGKYTHVEKRKKKGTASKAEPYYGKMFVLEDDVTVDRVISILKKKSFVNPTDRDMRLKYACCYTFTYCYHSHMWFNCLHSPCA